MKTFSLALPLLFSTLGLAAPAPAALEKRVEASITLYPNTNYGGTPYVISFNIQEQTCVRATLPASIDRQASSVRLSRTGSGSGFNCRLSTAQNCDTSVDSTWFIFENIPDLAQYGADNPPPLNLDNRIRSVMCSPVS